MISGPLVSVILPTYNHAHFIVHALDSTLAQTYQNYEIIIVNDGSTDQTGEVVQRYTDERIRYIYQANRGLAGARNTGLRAARGEYVVFLDADDQFLPNKLETQVKWLLSHEDMGLVAGGWNLIDEDQTVIETYLPGPNFPDMSVAGWLKVCHVCPIAVMVKRAWVERVGGFDETLRQVEDWDLWLRLAYAGCKMGWVNELVCCYRLSTGQMTSNAAAQKAASVQMLAKFFNQPVLPEEFFELQNEVFYRLYLISAGREYGAGQWQDAQSSLLSALSYYPQLSQAWSNEAIDLLFGWDDSFYNRSSRRMSSIEFRDFVFDHLPEFAVRALRSSKRRLMSEAGLKTIWTAYQMHDWQNVRKAFLILLQYTPQNIFRRDILSMLVRSFRSPLVD